MISHLAYLGISRAEKALAPLHLRIFGERSSLSVFMLHSVYVNAEEVEQNGMDPQQGLTLEHFRQLVTYYLEHGFKFVSPGDILRGLAIDGRYALLSFDDGYYNNHRVVPVLEEFRIPAVFSISTRYVTEQKAFWWDTLYREGRKRGKSVQEIYEQGSVFKSWRHDQIDEYLKQNFTAQARVPVGDLDRAFTSSELKDFAINPFVVIGNHTSDHASLPCYAPAEARAQVLEAQEVLRSITGSAPKLIAYPSGLCSAETIEVVRQAGLQLGLTGENVKSYLPIDFNRNQNFLLGRFVPWASADLTRQFEGFRSDLLLSHRVRRLKRSVGQWLTGR